MPIDSHSSLVAAIKSYAVRSDTAFNTRVDDFILMAEERIYHGFGMDAREPAYSPPLRSSAMETTGTIAITDGVGTIPSDYLLIRKLHRTGDDVGIKYVPPERRAFLAAIHPAGTPIYYTIEGRTLTLVPAAGSDTLNATYYRSFAALTNAAPSNDLLIAHPMVYLEASLVEAFAWMQAPDQAIAHAAKCRSMIQGINATSQPHVGPLRVRHRVPIP